jgi:hypothetical protein
MSFIEKIRKNKIAQPTKPNFNTCVWEKKWEQETPKDNENESVYHAGKIIFSLLKEIRSRLASLHKRAPLVSNENLIEAYFAISNRDRAILSKSHDTLNTDELSVFSSLLKNNKMSNELTTEEIANGCVDAIEKAVYFRMDRTSNQNKQSAPINPLTIIRFISEEALLSQMYGVYEGLWQALLWGEYSFYEMDKKKNIFVIVQNMTPFEIGKEASQIRKSRLSAQPLLEIHRDKLSLLFLKDKYIFKKSNICDTLRVRTLDSADESIQSMNTVWRVSETYLEDEFPRDIILMDQGVGFSISEALNTLRMLMLLSIQITSNYPADDSFQDARELSSFCLKIKTGKLKKIISEATGYHIGKVSKILSFIEFDRSKNKDLWCHPIIAVKPASYIFLTSALITPAVKRVVEHWLVTLDIDLGAKGIVFEQQTLDKLNDALKENKSINDYDQAVSKRIRLDNGEEEIDLLCRIGSTIIVGEAKSVVTTDSPISSYRALETLKGATKQATRKTEFVKNNLEELFSKLDWTYDNKIKYSFVKCVVNSNRMYVGNIIDNVPICDEKILIRYFESSVAPVFTNQQSKNLAWLELYDNFDELQNNLDFYLKNPHQIILDTERYEHKSIGLPIIDEGSFKMCYKRIVPKDISPEEYLKKQHNFPLKTVSNLEEELRKIDVIV